VLSAGYWWQYNDDHNDSRADGIGVQSEEGDHTSPLPDHAPGADTGGGLPAILTIYAMLRTAL
jgi:hypothetical protein